MKFNNEIAENYGIKITESYFEIFMNTIYRGPNFNWKNFYYEMLPGLIETQLWMNNSNKNWKKYLSIAVKAGQAKCLSLLQENHIDISSSERWYVYIVKCSDNTLYTGIAKDIYKRIEQHNKGKGAKYTRGRGPVTLVKSFECLTKGEALRLEYQTKQLSKKEKLAK
jgi:putative endonuclease